MKRVLYDVSSPIDRRNIILKLWRGCLDASKTLPKDYVAECNPDGTPKRLEPYTPKMREDHFNSMSDLISIDPVYRTGVESAPVWELRKIGDHNKKMYLEGVPSDSPVRKHIKDRNRLIISAEDIDILR